MSIGYIPKKLKHERRQRRLKKKYKNFSCETCIRAEMCIERFNWRTYRNNVILSCPKWKPSHTKKEVSYSKKVEKKRKRKFFR